MQVVRRNTCTSRGNIDCAILIKLFIERESYEESAMILSAFVAFHCVSLTLSKEVGRLVEPPSRGSMWRFVFVRIRRFWIEFILKVRNRFGFFAPRNDADAETDCGGFNRQWHLNRGRCGLCGDPDDLEQPRPHEDGGKFGNRIVTREYIAGQIIKVRTEVTDERLRCTGWIGLLADVLLSPPFGLIHRSFKHTSTPNKQMFL